MTPHSTTMSKTATSPNGITPNGHAPSPERSADAEYNAAYLAVAERIETNLARVIRGKDDGIRLLLLALLAGGHVLLEDAPGTGKTTLARALAKSIAGEFRRIQFTPDLLPGDITGSSFYNPGESRFEFRPGPVFCNVLLADEINRTSPRTQSALLEVMSEHQVSVEGRALLLPPPFFVLATQNPIEYHGIYPLPEAQLDRFAIRLHLGYPDGAHEVEILLSRHQSDPLDALEPVASLREVLALQEHVKTTRVEQTVAEYMVRLVAATREDARLRAGISPRGSLTLYRLAQAKAWRDGRDFVLPEDVRVLAAPVLAHRLVPDTKTRYGGVDNNAIIAELLDKVPVPR